ncbi:hypothetical protein KR222_002800 [Zaprionus bogoriensis]|nr:hypothetical protein KR222_002800 [Zaprionus bogoriensis]
MPHHSNLADSSDSADTPPQLSTVGLCRASKIRTSMSKPVESHRLLRSQTMAEKADEEEDDLFVKLPKFSKRQRSKHQTDNQEEDSDASSKELVVNQRLYKYLKQPNCQRWVWCEFIESFLDQAILASAYDMNSYLHSCFPALQSRQLPRRCWQIIRRNMGKARRFSTAFIAGERVELERCRRIVRLLQCGKVDMEQDGQSLELMPKLIPLPLPVDAKVISLLSKPQLSLCKGRVVGYEPKDSSYLVKFEVAGKNKVLSMPDCLLHALQECKSQPLASIVQEAEEKSENGAEEQGPKALLDALLQLQKLLALKRQTVQDMAVMNEELEASGVPAPVRREVKLTPQREKLQRRYAANMITLHRVNADILEPLRVANNQLNEYEQDAHQRKSLPGNKLYEKCRVLAEMDLKSVLGQTNAQLEASRELILRLQTLLYLYGELGFGNDVEVDAVIEDFVTNMLVEMPPQLSAEFAQVLALLQPLREHILGMYKLETGRCQKMLQLHQRTEDSDIEMGL